MAHAYHTAIGSLRTKAEGVPLVALRGPKQQSQARGTAGVDLRSPRSKPTRNSPPATALSPEFRMKTNAFCIVLCHVV